MRVAAVISDLMLFSRIESAVSAAGASLVRVDSLTDLPPDLDLILVDWSARQPDWGDRLSQWRAGAAGARIVLFGRHTDLEAHAAARTAGLAPMWARSKLITELSRLLPARSSSNPRVER